MCDNGNRYRIALYFTRLLATLSLETPTNVRTPSKLLGNPLRRPPPLHRSLGPITAVAFNWTGSLLNRVVLLLGWWLAIKLNSLSIKDSWHSSMAAALAIYPSLFVCLVVGLLIAQQQILSRGLLRWMWRTWVGNIFAISWPNENLGGWVVLTVRNRDHL